MDSLAPLAAADNQKWGLVEVLRMSLPVSLTMLGRTVTQFVDGLMVSRLGAATLSAQCVGGMAAFVLGNTRWGGIVVPVDHLVLRLAEEAGLKPERVMVTRMKGNSPQQMQRYGRIPVRESIVVVRKP